MRKKITKLILCILFVFAVGLSLASCFNSGNNNTTTSTETSTQQNPNPTTTSRENPTTTTTSTPTNVVPTTTSTEDNPVTIIPSTTTSTQESTEPVFVDVARKIKIVQLEGTATVTDEDDTYDCFVGMNLYSGDVLEVANQSVAVVKFDNDKYVYFGSNSKVNIVSDGSDKYKTNIFIERGTVLAELQNKLGVDEEFFLSSNNSVMAVRGTVFGVQVKEENGEIVQTYSVYKGVTELYVFDNTSGELVSGKLSDISNAKYEIKIPKEEIIGNEDFGEILGSWLTDVSGQFSDATDANEQLDEVQITVSKPSKEEYEEVLETVSQEPLTYSDIVYTSEGYFGNYDGQAHKITVNVETEGAQVFYKGENDTEYSSENTFEYTEPGSYRVFYKIVCEGYDTKEDYEVIQITKAHLSALEHVELTINTPLIAGTPLAQALKDVDLLEYYNISGVEGDADEMVNTTFDLSGTLIEGTNNYRVEVILPDSIKDKYDAAYIDVELTTQELIVDSYCIFDGNLNFNYVHNDDLNKYNGIKETSLFDDLTLYAGSKSITRSDCKSIKFIYDYLVEGYFEITEGKNEVGVEIEFDDYTITTTASFNVNDTRYVPEIVVTPDSNYVTSLGGNNYNFKNVANLPYENGVYTITGEMLYEAFGVSSSSDVLINLDKNANDEIVDYDLYGENGTFEYTEEELLPLEFRILPTYSRKSASLSLNLYFAATVPAEYPTYEISDNLVYKYSSTGTVINDAVISRFPVKYSLDDETYDDSVTITEIGTHTVYFTVGTDNQVKDSVEVIIKASKISSDSLGFIQDEVSLISNDNGHIIEYQRSLSEGYENLVLKASDNTVISPFDDVYTVYSNIVLNGEYYDSVTKEPLTVNATVSPKTSGSADFTYSISCEGYETIEGECKFVYTEIGEVGSILSVTNPSDLEFSISDLSSIYATEPTCNLSSANSDVSDSIYYSIDNGKTWSNESPLLSGVGTYTIYSIFCAYYSGTPFNPVGKEPSETYYGLSANGNFIVSIQTIVITE